MILCWLCSKVRVKREDERAESRWKLWLSDVKVVVLKRMVGAQGKAVEPLISDDKRGDDSLDIRWEMCLRETDGGDDKGWGDRGYSRE